MAEYIEREKIVGILNDNLGNSAIRSAVNGYPEEYFDGWTDAVSEAITEVEDIPAADVRPEIYGSWISTGDYFLCSECDGGSLRCYPFCMHCCAKMDGINQEGDIK